MKNLFTKIKLFVVLHKVWTSVIVLVLVFGSWQMYKKVTNTDSVVRYVTATVTKGTIVSSVSASGQVESTNQVDLKAGASGRITYVGVKPGDHVRRGKTLFAVDAKDAEKSVRNAENSLEIAKLELEKLQRPPQTVDVLAIEQAIRDAEQSRLDAEKNVKEGYRDLLNTSTVATSSVAGTSVTAPTITGTYTKDQESVIHINVYQTGSGATFNVYSTPAGVVNANGSVSTTLAVPIGDSGLYIKFAATNSQPDWEIHLPNKTVAAYQTNYQAYQDALTDQKKANDAADLTILQKKEELSDLYKPDEFELRSKELAVKQAEDNLQGAKDDLRDYYVYAPFDGVVASVDARVGETAATTLGSMITNQKLATLSLNEVDVSKINLGQKATITFDAVEELSVTGTVVQIDTLGTVTQGVVSYVVKVAFDTDESKIKPGMSVSANIIIDSKVDVLNVPSSAVKNKNGEVYVEVFDVPLVPPTDGVVGSISVTLPRQVPVIVGISDDISTEIISGIKEGDQIISRTITTKTTPTTTSAPSLFGGATAGGGTRALGR